MNDGPCYEPGFRIMVKNIFRLASSQDSLPAVIRFVAQLND